MLKLTYIGDDYWSCPTYTDQHKKIWKDIALGESETPSLCLASDFDGDPGSPINKKYVIVKPRS